MKKALLMNIKIYIEERDGEQGIAIYHEGPDETRELIKRYGAPAYNAFDKFMDNVGRDAEAFAQGINSYGEIEL